MIAGRCDTGMTPWNLQRGTPAWPALRSVASGRLAAQTQQTDAQRHERAAEDAVDEPDAAGVGELGAQSACQQGIERVRQQGAGGKGRDEHQQLGLSLIHI